jgi:probable F420-dependent oxidoreductase
VRFAIAIPQIFSTPRFDTAMLRNFLRKAEALDYHSVWVQEQIFGRAGNLESVTLLSYAAALTQNLKLGAAVLLTLLKSPVQLAKSLATLDQLSNGRLIAGVGLGGNTRFYPAFGLSAEKRVARFTEGLTLMKRLWTEEIVTVDGQFWKLENASLHPKPVQQPYPPIWFGARQPAALKRAVELGDGFIGAGSSSAAEFREHVGHLRNFLSEAQRDPSNFPIAKRVYLHVDPDKTRALERLREWFGWYYGSAALADQVALVGGPKEIIQGLQEIRSAGAELILLNPILEEMDQMELLAREVVSACSSA